MLVAALITRSGPPAGLLEAARAGRFDLLVSPRLLAELVEVLRRERFRRYASLAEVDMFVRSLVDLAEPLVDPPADAVVAISRDPQDDYLIALARAGGAAVLVSGDKDLTSLELPDLPVLTPRALLDRLHGSQAHRATGADAEDP